MAENGILDYQGMNQAIYRGATSNIIVDTQNMSIEIGAGNSSHTSNLHIECDHDANVASIQLNSNVVTEFSRSKKLIKYPRVALNSASQDSYVVTSSTDAYDNTYFHRYDPFRPFVSGSANGWHTGPPHTSTANSWDQTFDTSGYNKNITSYGSGGYAGTSIAGIESEWLKLELPHKIVLSHFFYQHRDGEIVNYHQAPKDFRILGSNDDVNWDTIKTFTGQASHPEGQTLTAEATKGYKYLAFVVTATQTPTGTSHLSLKNLEYYGVPEYDPEAYGTDVTVKSVANVPNTDWLEVYYDAKNYTSGVVQDLSTNSFNGTLTNGASYNNSDGIDKFVFDAGTNQYMTTTTNISGSAFIHTTSMWVKFVEVSTDSNNQHYLFMLGTFGSNSIGMYYSANQGIRVSPTGFDYRTQYHPVAGRWFHVSYTYAGGAHGTAAVNTTVKFYINGQQWNIPAYYGNTTTVTLPSSSVLQINGSAGNNNTLMDMEVANFRLFNRALTSDEIYQLYAYQKEYFGHGDLSMTLKAGRLGIGTSEPRAALDVRGGFQCGNSPLRFYVLHGIHPSSGNQNIDPPNDTIFDASKIISITGITKNDANGSSLPFERHSESSGWEVDIFFDTNLNKFHLSSHGSSARNNSFSVFVVTT